MALSRKQRQILNALNQGKDVTFIIITFDTDSNEVEKLSKYLKKIKKAKRPHSKFYIASNSCFITYNGHELTNNVRPIYNGGSPHATNWLDIESKCLLCAVENSRAVHRTREALFVQLSYYFLRTPKALSAHYAKLIGSVKECRRLKGLYNKK